MSEKPTLTTDAAREVLQVEEQRRVEACKVELEALMKKHHCRLEVSILLRAGQVIPQLQILAE